MHESKAHHNETCHPSSVTIFGSQWAHTFLKSTWSWTTPWTVTGETPSPQAMPVSLMNMSSLIRLSARHTLPFAVNVLGSHDRWLSTPVLASDEAMHHLPRHTCLVHLRQLATYPHRRDTFKLQNRITMRTSTFDVSSRPAIFKLIERRYDTITASSHGWRHRPSIQCPLRGHMGGRNLLHVRHIVPFIS